MFAVPSVHTSSDDVGPQLLQWLADWGAEVDGRVVSRRCTHGGRGLFASELVSNGSTLMRLPPELCLRAPTEEDLSDLDFSNLRRDEVVEVRMTVAVLQAIRDRSWAEYVGVWPSQEVMEGCLPVFWDEARLCQAAHNFPSIPAQVSDRQTLLGKVALLLSLPLDEITYAHAVVTTRAVGSDRGWCALLPGVDMANHDPVPSARIVVAGQPGEREGRATRTEIGEVWEYGSAGLVACRDIALGEEIRICYGPLSNERLLYDYGFTLGPENLHGELGWN